jgi:CHAT domain
MSLNEVTEETRPLRAFDEPALREHAVTEPGWLTSNSEVMRIPQPDELVFMDLLAVEPGLYPRHLGPVGYRYAMVQSGLIRLEEAEVAVTNDVELHPLPEAYIDKMADVAVGLVSRGQRDQGWALARLLLAGLDKTGPDGPLWHRGAWAYVQCAMALLSRCADGRLYRTARSVADRLESATRGAADNAMLARALSCAGQLRLATYARPGGLQWWEDDTAWRGELALRIGPNLGADLESLRLEQPVPELKRAAALLAEAADRRSGPERGRTLASLAQVYRLLIPVGEAAADDLLHAASEGASLINPSTHPGQLLTCLEILASYTDEVSRLAERLLDIPVGHLRETFGDRRTLELLAHTVSLARRIGAFPAASRLLHEAGDLVGQPSPGAEDDRLDLMGEAVHVIDGGLISCADDVGEALRRVNELADAGELDERLHGAALVHLAAHAASPAVAFSLLDQEAGQLDPYQPEAAVRELVRGTTALEEARHRMHDSPESAIEAAGWACDAFLMAQLIEPALIALRLAADGVHGDGGERRTALLQAIGSKLLRVAVLGGESAMDTIHGLGLLTSAAVLPRPGAEVGSPEELFIHRQLFKGLLFAVGLAAPGPMAEDEEVSRLRAEVAILEPSSRSEPLAQAGGPTAGPVGPLIQGEEEELEQLFRSSEIHRCAFVGPRELQSGTTASQRLVNVRMQLDEYVTRKRYLRSLPPEILSRSDIVRFKPLERVMGALGERTVFLDFYLGQQSDGKGVALAADLTWARPGQVHIVWQPDVAPAFQLNDRLNPGRSLLVHPAAMSIAELRAALQENPAPRLVTREAEAILRRSDTLFLDGLAARLASLRADGYDHLCIWPHGPLHYAPIHLFYVDGRPISDDWTVTTVPTLDCLFPRTEAMDPEVEGPAARSAAAELLVAACPDGGRPYGLVPLPTLRDQAEAIARSVTARLLPATEASPERVLGEMADARYVHIAAHGSGSEAAPMWQCLYLSPGDDGEGRLFAHQILTADLRRVQLVTLSACESSLGRFDLYDNLRGLPAALLLAGARAVVGTLWPTRPDPATRFFCKLYETIAQGSGQLDAFRVAQIATREDYPEYRDWGAFTYFGHRS